MGEQYELVRVANGEFSLRSKEHQETFHPVIGPVAEATALYVQQLKLPERIGNTREEFVIWDVGLGAAANPLTLLKAIEKNRAVIRIVSFDCTVEPLRFGLKHCDKLPFLQGFESELSELMEAKQVRFERADGPRVHWELHLGDFPEALQTQWIKSAPKPHTIFYDAFSPKKNPRMWSLPLFKKLYSLLDPDRPCAMPTYSRSSLLRVTLLLAGFYAGLGHATGEKEETTIAANSLLLIDQPLDRTWLFRAKRSTSAEPLRGEEYRQEPLRAETWELLQNHPQFRL